MPLSSDNWNAQAIPDRVRERAATRWVRSADCWISTYSTGSHGYAQIGWQAGPKTRTVLAHRASWEHQNGAMPIGYTLDHLCKQRQCVNPSHLRVLANYDNARRTSGRDWPLGQCVNGHSDSFSKLYSNGPGKSKKRRCGLCFEETRKRHEQKRRAA